MPPASSHFAESPIPAPPPMIGRPWRTISRNLASRASRSNSAMVSGRNRAERSGEGVRKGRVVDGVRQALHVPARGRLHAGFERVEQGLIGHRVVEWLTWRVDRGNT